MKTIQQTIEDNLEARLKEIEARRAKALFGIYREGRSQCQWRPDSGNTIRFFTTLQNGAAENRSQTQTEK